MSERRCCNFGARALITLGWVLMFYMLYFYNYAAFCGWKNPNAFARMALVGDPQLDGNNRLRLGYYGVIDLLINDIYMNHIMYNVAHFLKPTHVMVMGDLLGSQYIPEDEFQSRVSRYNFIFRDCINRTDITLINLVGNHDIGYGNEVNEYLLGRFERAFGKTNANYWIKETPTSPTTGQHLLVVANGQVLDPSRDAHIRGRTWSHLMRARALATKHNATVLLAEHIPLHKPAHVCVDEPKVFTTDGSGDVFRGGIVYSQNTLSTNSTDFLLNYMKPEFVFVGHDHEGCVFDHQTHIGKRVREYTLRSIMGDYSGYIGLFEISKTIDGAFEYHFQYCPYVWIKIAIALGASLLVWFGLVLLFVLWTCCRR